MWGGESDTAEVRIHRKCKAPMDRIITTFPDDGTVRTPCGEFLSQLLIQRNQKGSFFRLTLLSSQDCSKALR